MINEQECAELLSAHDHFLILTHRNPDGDTAGSAGALCRILRRLGKTAYLYPNPQFTPKLSAFISDLSAPDGYRFAYIVAVDVASESQLPQNFEGSVDLCIDHHGSNTSYAGAVLVEAEKASCAEVVYHLSRLLAGGPSPVEATLLYLGLSTDCGCFRFSNTKAETFQAAADLASCGAEIDRVNELFFRRSSRGRLKLEGMIYSGMRFEMNDRVAAAFITPELIRQCGADEDDCSNLASLPVQAEGVDLGVTIKDSGDGTCRVSLRSGDKVNSNEICAVFGGGGHVRAAGCSIPGSPDEVYETLMQVIREKLDS